jgi:hypothetical protein
MSTQMDKTRLLHEIRTGYAALEEILAPLDETRMTTFGVSGDWSIKDILAHITAWHRYLLDRLQAAARNESPSVYITGLDDEEVDRLNEQFYQENKSRALDEVMTDFRSTYLQIVEAVQAMQEEDLTDAQRFSWARGIPLWRFVAGDTYEHYLEHIGPIKDWLAKTRQA